MEVVCWKGGEDGRAFIVTICSAFISQNLPPGYLLQLCSLSAKRRWELSLFDCLQYYLEWYSTAGLVTETTITTKNFALHFLSLYCFLQILFVLWFISLYLFCFLQILFVSWIIYLSLFFFLQIFYWVSDYLFISFSFFGFLQIKFLFVLIILSLFCFFQLH